MLLVNKKKGSWLLILICALAVILRLFRLGHQSLWIDEINCVILSGKNIFKILLANDTTPPFIYLVSHFWQKLGSSDFMVRFPSVIFGVLSILAAYKLAKALFGSKEALFSSFLMAISLYHIMYSQEAARPYSAFMIFSLLSLYCLYRGLNTGRRAYWIGLIIFNTLNLYTQFFAIFILVSQIIIWLVITFYGFFEKGQIHRSSFKEITSFTLALISILILSLPISMQFLSAANFEIAAGKVAFKLAYYKNLLCRYGAGNGLAFFIYNFFFLGGLASLFKGSKRKEVLLLLFCLTFPFFILSFMELKHFFHIRYVIFTYPLYVMIVSKGITNILGLRPAYSGKIVCVIILIFASLAFVPLKFYYSMPARLTDWKGAAEHIYRTANGKAKVITQEWHDNLIKYYLAKEPDDKGIEVSSHHNDVRYFAKILSNSYNRRRLYYVGYGEDIGLGTDEFSMLAEGYFSKKEAFFSPVYLEMAKRELIDWDGNSWVDVGARGYRLVVYSN